MGLKPFFFFFSPAAGLSFACYWLLFQILFAAGMVLRSQTFDCEINSTIISKLIIMHVCRLLQNNAISGPIPDSIGKLEKLETLDLSHNKFDGGIPSSLGGLKKLNYL